MDYFAYGSNLNLTDLNNWCDDHDYKQVKPLKVKVGVLKGYKLDFNYKSSGRKSRTLNIMRDRDSEVEGAILSLTKEDYQTIYKKEGAPNYYKEIEVIIHLNNKTKRVKTFKVVNSKEEKHFEPPTEEYLDIFTGGAEKMGLSNSYIREVERNASVISDKK